jgi:hypothetical protein
MIHEEMSANLRLLSKNVSLKFSQEAMESGQISSQNFDDVCQKDSKIIFRIL